MLQTGLNLAQSWEGKLEGGVRRKDRKGLCLQATVAILEFEQGVKYHYKHHCVGVIVGPYTVLTAGSCTNPFREFCSYNATKTYMPFKVVGSRWKKHFNVIRMESYSGFTKDQSSKFDLGVVTVSHLTILPVYQY